LKEAEQNFWQYFQGLASFKDNAVDEYQQL
jgi:hypothetical protein